MDVITILLLCAVPAAALGLMLAGADGVIDLLCRHCEAFRAWHDREIRAIEEWQEDE